MAVPRSIFDHTKKERSFPGMVATLSYGMNPLPSSPYIQENPKRDWYRPT